MRSGKWECWKRYSITCHVYPIPVEGWVMTEIELHFLRRKDFLLSTLMAVPAVFIVLVMFASPNPLILVSFLSISLVLYGSMRLFTLEKRFTVFAEPFNVRVFHFVQMFTVII